jgi:hypothetical protein
MASPRAKLLAFLFLLAFGLIACGNLPAQQNLSSQDECQVTKPGDPETGLFGPPDGLQVFISNGGIWSGLGEKVFWKYPGYSETEEPRPDLRVTGEQLGANATFIQEGPATNAFGNPDLLGSAILTGVEIPQAGCWQLTGQYRDSQLSFVVWVGD